MKGKLILLLTIVIASLKSCVPVELTDKELDNACQSKKCFVKIYSPTCGHCKRMESDWNELANKYCNQSSVLIGQIDGSKYDTVLLRFDLKGFPSVLLFEGANYYEYIGDRSMRSLDDFLKEHANSEMHISPPNPSLMRKYYIMFLQALDMLIMLLDKLLIKVNLVWIPKSAKMVLILFILMLPTIFLLGVLLCLKPKATKVEKKVEGEKTKKDEKAKEEIKEDIKMKKE